MYQASYRKWRPKTFSDVLSQPHITNTLQNELKAGRIAHAYLFTGSRGTGKTTCARILAMAVNCEQPNEDGSPCLKCPSCIGIDQGSVLDVAEIDAATNSGVDDVRKLREEAYYTPASCKYRVYIIDEVHMLSSSAFNALLKIMEEPPAHVIFILATTEVHKIPATIISRCQRFDFHRVRAEDIAAKIQLIASNEPFTITEEAAELIAKLSDGGMRDALSLLDQCVAYEDNVTAETVSLAAGLADRSYLKRYADAIASKNASAALELTDELYRQSRDLTRLCEELITYYRNLMIAKTVKNPESLILCMPSELTELKDESKKISLPDILYSVSVLRECFDRISGTSAKRTEFEMCMIKLCTPSLNSSSEAILARLDEIESKLRSGAIVEKTDADPLEVQPETIIEKPVSVKAPKKKQISDEQAAPEERKEPASSDSAGGIILESGGKAVPVNCWSEILNRLSKTDPPLCGLLVGSTACILDDAFYITSENSMLSSLLRKDGAAGRLSEAIVAELGKKYRLRVRTAPTRDEKKDQSKENLDRLILEAEQEGIPINFR